MKNKGFTLIELLVVIALIGLLSSIVLSSLSAARSKGRDAQRLSHMKQIQNALELYRSDFGAYPSHTSDGGQTNWDYSSIDSNSDGDYWLDTLVDNGYISETPLDPLQVDNSTTYAYRYYRYSYPSWSYCDKSTFYVLGIMTMESVSGTHPKSPGWSCTNNTRNWQTGISWVTGAFE